MTINCPFYLLMKQIKNKNYLYNWNLEVLLRACAIEDNNVR